MTLYKKLRDNYVAARKTRTFIPYGFLLEGFIWSVSVAPVLFILRLASLASKRVHFNLEKKKWLGTVLTLDFATDATFMFVVILSYYGVVKNNAAAA